MAQITTQHKGNMLFASQVGNHQILIDVPSAMGGADRGPTPPEFFVASLGSCVAALVANYCEKVGIDATGLSVDVSYDKASDPTRLTNLTVQIDLPHGDISGREEAILRVAERCPVHETISNLGDVKISLDGHST